MKDLKDILNESIVNESKSWKVENEDDLEFADLHNSDDLVAFIEVDATNKKLVYHSLKWANDMRNSDDDNLADFGEELLDLKSGENTGPNDRIYIRL